MAKLKFCIITPVSRDRSEIIRFGAQDKHFLSSSSMFLITINVDNQTVVQLNIFVKTQLFYESSKDQKHLFYLSLYCHF